MTDAGKSTLVKTRRGAAVIYVVAALLTWPAVTLVIYWGDRLTNALPGLAQAGTPISFWAAGGCALLVSALILVAGWLQSSKS